MGGDGKFTKDDMEEEDDEDDSEMGQQPRPRGNRKPQQPQTPKFDSRDMSKVGQLHVEMENGQQVYYKIKKSKKFWKKRTKKVKMSEKDLQKHQAKEQGGGSDDDSDRRRRRRLMMRLANAEAAMSARVNSTTSHTH